jgi:membrane-bound lytic murein transglycosylase D
VEVILKGSFWFVAPLIFFITACNPNFFKREPSPPSTTPILAAPLQSQELSDQSEEATSDKGSYELPLEVHPQDEADFQEEKIVIQQEAEVPQNVTPLEKVAVQKEEMPPKQDGDIQEEVTSLEKEPEGQRGKTPLEIGEGEKEREITFDIPIVINDRVEYFIEYFKIKHKKEFALWLKRSGKYVPLMKEILKENGLPEDLVYLAMIESGFNPQAYSRRKASGPWQFIHRTGKKYGLVVNWWIDERRDPEKSTIAAASYLKDLYDQFSCWYLAAAGYNAGEGKIFEAIKRYRTEDFWELAKYRYLKMETKNFVPKMIAAALIAKEPEKHGFADIDYDEPIRYEKVEIPTSTDLMVIARCCEVDYESIKALNPALKRRYTPPNHPGFQIHIPAGEKEVFLQNFSRLKPSERITLQRHHVKFGETLSQIAVHYGTEVKPIMQINGITNPRRLRTGTSIIIPIPNDKVSSLNNKGTKKNIEAMRKNKEGETSFEEIYYVVKEGDTLWDIARLHNLEVNRIRSWNKIKGDLIRPNDKLLLKIKKEEKG